MISSKKMLTKYVNKPERSDMSVAIRIGAVANGLMKNPIPTTNPPAECKMAENAAISAANIITFVWDQFRFIC